MAGQIESEATGGEAPVEMLDSLPFGGDLVAHNRATGALCILNGTAGEALALMQAGHGEAAVAERIAARYQTAPGRVAGDLAQLKTALAQAGLIGAAGGAEADVTPSAVAEARVPALAETAFEAIVSCGGRAVRLRCEEPALGALLAEVLRPAASRAAPEGTLELAGADGLYQCRRDERPVWSCGPRPLARRNLLREAIVATLPGPPAALLHASGVVTGGGAVVLAGDSGSGKTTLAAGLVGSGGRLVADDLLPLLPGGALAPVPFALSLKEGSWPLLARHFPAIAGLPVLESRGLKVRYLWPGAECAATTPARPAAILFPQRRAGAAAEPQSLSPRETLERLIDSGTRLEPADGALAALVRLAAETPAFALRYDRLDDGAAAVAAVLGAP